MVPPDGSARTLGYAWPSPFSLLCGRDSRDWCRPVTRSVVDVMVAPGESKSSSSCFFFPTLNEIPYHHIYSFRRTPIMVPPDAIRHNLGIRLSVFAVVPGFSELVPVARSVGLRPASICGPWGHRAREEDVRGAIEIYQVAVLGQVYNV